MRTPLMEDPTTTPFAAVLKTEPSPRLRHARVLLTGVFGSERLAVEARHLPPRSRARAVADTLHTRLQTLEANETDLGLARIMHTIRVAHTHARPRRLLPTTEVESLATLVALMGLDGDQTTKWLDNEDTHTTRVLCLMTVIGEFEAGLPATRVLPHLPGGEQVRAASMLADLHGADALRQWVTDETVTLHRRAHDYSDPTYNATMTELTNMKHILSRIT